MQKNLTVQQIIFLMGDMDNDPFCDEVIKIIRSVHSEEIKQMILDQLVAAAKADTLMAK